MGGPSALRRGGACAAVVALHVGLVVTLIVGLRAPTRLPVGEFVSTLILRRRLLASPANTCRAADTSA